VGFTVVLQYLSGLKCVVFVKTKEGELGQRFLRLADAGKVLSALAGTYPWLEQALGRAWATQHLSPLTDRISKENAKAIVKTFIGDPAEPGTEDPEVRRFEDPQAQGWERLGDAYVWEHAKWLDFDRLREDVGGVMYDRELSQFVDSPDASRSERTQAILRRQSPYVALVNSE
jgi:hypothetical protein